MVKSEAKSVTKDKVRAKPGIGKMNEGKCR